MQPSATLLTQRLRPHIPSLDGLRAISFLIVFLGHACTTVIPASFGVTTFFFLSGYLITTLMRVEEHETGRVNLKHFYLRRILRILPPFYSAFALSLLLSQLDPSLRPSDPDPAAILWQALQVSNYWIAKHGWSSIVPGTGAFWSLAVEEHFYLLFPAIYLFFGSRGLSARQSAVILWGACALALIWRCVLVVGMGSHPERTALCSDARFDSILFGCALALWDNPAFEPNAESVELPSRWRLCVLPAAALLLVVTFAVRNPAFRETWRYTLQGVGLTAVFVAAIRWPRWYVFRPLNWRPVRFVGVLSYSLYLVHQLILELMERHCTFPRWQIVSLSLAFAFGLAWVIYETIEKPCATIRKRLASARPLPTRGATELATNVASPVESRELDRSPLRQSSM
ncbi:MAG TPA: acyltransferase [Polyangiaceae bacterium]